jgi:hypothetical protein
LGNPWLLLTTGFFVKIKWFFLERRDLMTFLESCIYYQDSKCTLKGGCCDLNCGMAESDRGNLTYDESDPFVKWQIEKVQKEKNSEPTLG